MSDPISLLREMPSSSSSPQPSSSSSPPQPSPLSTSSSSQPTATPTTVTLSKHRRVQRIIKKHLQQKYLLCGFVIHALLASPAYLYGIIVDNNKALIIRIWPAIIYQAIGQISHSFLLHSIERYQINKINKSQWENRKIFIFATILICTGIIICGFLFSSAWIGITPTTQLIAVVIYGLFGGIGSSLIYTRTYVILEIVRPIEDKYVQKTIHICGEAFCQLFLCFVFTSLRSLYGISQTLALMAALLTNLIPLGLLISRQDNKNLRKKIPFIRSQENVFQGINRISMQSAIEQIDGIELQQTTWKNPRNPIEIRYNYITLAMEDPFMTTHINPNGVEIMEIIPEEDENVSTLRSSSVTIDKHNKMSIDFNQEKFIYNRNRSNLNKIHEFSKNLINQIVDNVKDYILIPLQRAMIIVKLYPATFLQSTDIFSYVMCLIVLPGLAVRQHSLKFAEIPFLYSLLAFPWMCFALMTPRFGQSLVKEKNKWHAFGCILKSIALFFISISESKLLLSLAAVLLGFGQAISLFLQDLIVQNSIPRAQWIDVKYPLYLISGVLMFIWGTGAHLVINNFGFQASVKFSTLLYFLSITVWYTCTTKNLLFKKNVNR